MGYIRVENVTKRYGSLVANERVNLSVQRGEIHAVVGENGAGKSTLMKMLFGMISPDEGAIYVEGQVRRFRSPSDAFSLGIGMVHQHFMLAKQMNVLENLILGAEPTTSLGNIDVTASLNEFEKLSQFAHSSPLPAKKLVVDLEVGEQQRLEIIKLLFRRCECLIFDEPTGVLAPTEIGKLLHLMLELKRAGKTILLVTHKLREVLQVSDRISVMRGGQLKSTFKPEIMTPQELAHLMVGRDLPSLEKRYSRAPTPLPSIPLLEVRRLRLGKIREPLTLNVGMGEVLGIAGVEGNGQSDLLRSILGLEPSYEGDILFKGKSLKSYSVAQRKKLGMRVIPQDRHQEALVLDHSVRENFYLGTSDSQFLISRAQLEKDTLKAIEDFRIQVKHLKDPVRFLSGGNQQLLVLARELSRSPAFLVVAQPTRGVDVGASERIHTELLSRRNQGMGMLLISSELEELWKLSDRILVLSAGEITREFRDLDVDFEILRKQIGEAMLWHS